MTDRKPTPQEYGRKGGLGNRGRRHLRGFASNRDLAKKAGAQGGKRKWENKRKEQS